MGFLSGVLSAVKDDDAVKTYDNMMSNKLQNVLDLLTTKIGSGRAGLAASVGAVKGWLEGYEREVKERTEAVHVMMINMNENITDHHIPKCNNAQDKSLKELHDKFVLALADIDGNMSTLRANKDGYKALDDDLKSKLDLSLGKIETAINVLKRSAAAEELTHRVDHVDEQLVRQRKNIEDEILEDGENLKHKITKHFNKVVKEINYFNVKKKEKFEHLSQAVTFAKADANNLLVDLDVIYKKDIEERFIEIELHLANIDKNKNGGTKSYLKQKLHAMQHEITQIHKKLRLANENLTTWIAKAESALYVVLKSANKVHNGLFLGNTDASSIGYHLKKLNDTHQKGNGGVATDGSVEYVLENGVKRALSDAGILVNEKLAENHHEKSLFKTIDEAANSIHKDANSVYSTMSRNLINVVSKLEKISDAITDSEFVITEVKGRAIDDGFTDDKITQLEELNKVLQSDLANITKLNDLLTLYGYGDVKDALTKIFDVVKEQLDGITNLKSASSSIHSKPSEIKEAITARVSSARKVFQKAVVSLKQELQVFKTKGSASPKHMTAVNKAMQNLNEISKSAGEVNSKLIEMFKATQDEINKEIELIWMKGTRSGPESSFNGKGLMKDVHEQVEKIKQQVVNKIGENKNANKSIRHTIDQARSTLYVLANGIKEKLNNDIKSKLAGIQNTMQQSVGAISRELSKLLGTLNDDVVEKLRDLKNNGIRGDEKWNTTVDLTNIKKNVDGILETNAEGNLKNTIHNTIPHVETIVNDELEYIPKKVYDAKEKARRIISASEKTVINIKTKIETVEEVIANVYQTITDIMHGVQQALSEARANSEKAVDGMRRQLTHKVQETFTYVTTQIRSLFAESHRADLSALRSLVDQQLNAVQDIIAKDKRNGVKGLLRWMNENRGHDLAELKKAAGESPPAPPEHSGKFKDLSKNFEQYADKILDYIAHQYKNPENSDVPTRESDNVKAARSCLDNLLNYLKCVPAAGNKLYAFDHNSDELLYKLEQSLNTLTPSFTSPSPLLAPLKSGLAKFAAQLGHAYVNRYSGMRFTQLTQQKTVKVTKDNGETTTEQKEELTTEGRNCAKVCLTIVEILSHDLGHLKNECERDWKTLKIYENDTDGENKLGSFLKRCGFKVAERDTSKDGELRLPSSGFSGDDITKLQLFTSIPHTNASKFLVNLDTLISYLNQYNQVGHLRHVKSPRNPCSIFEMLVWSYGLKHNGVYDELVKYCHKYDTSYDKKPDDDFKKRLTDTVDYSLSALCDHSRNILTTILGTGDEYTTYAVEYSDNSLNLKYPASGEDCLHTLLDILRRLLPTLRFLNNRCKLKTKDNGWRDCEYGMYTAPAKWPCTAHSSDKATSQPNTQPKCQPTCKVNSRANCQPTSPLQSYLNDCLPGHLPHKLIDVGCKSECKTCSPSTSGMPCVTPLGFKAFSCSTRRGEDICAVLSKFFNVAKLSPLFCLAPKPPSTLPEHMEFALALVKDWDSDATHPLKKTIHSTIQGASIQLYEKPEVLTDAITKAYGAYYASHDSCSDQHVSTLTGRDACTKQKEHCAPYLQSLCYDNYQYLVKKHCNLYVSWAVYLPWDFWSCLEKLCNAFQNIFCQDWGCRACLRADKCKRGEHGLIEKVEDKPDDPHCKCLSMVQCKGVSPTLYQFGFRFGHAATLNNETSPKSCSDFCSQLKKVLESQYFKDLFKQCDKFLFTIRAPFIWLNVALWLLSLLYLTHIMVIRLDLLHIKSHLHSPSSHRIAAQSLLAAARVNKLNRVFYLQP